jgi:twitching motility protein PilI
MNRRTSLREFQEQLSRRIAQAGSVAREAVRLCAVAGTEHWMLELPDAGEVVSVPELTPVPRTRFWFRGIANVRGALFGVVDLAAFLGQAPSVLRQESRLLLVGQRFGTNVALLVDGVLGLRKLGEFAPEVGAPEPAPAARASWVGEAYRDTDAARWWQLEVAALLADEEFLRVGV